VVSLIDVSGSMSNRVSGSSTRLVDIASEAILATSLALATIPRLAHAVGAFPSHRGDHYIELVQDFPERVEPISSRFDLSPRGSTPMAEALLWAANRLLQRDEERRIIFVATDGHPDDVTTTKEILVHLRKLGIEIHGIGIRSDDRYDLFDSFASIEEVGTLPKAFLSLFQRLLKRTA
jgi:cobaltochelatase CobT